MSQNNYFLHSKTWGILLFLAVFCWQPATEAKQPGWKRQQVNWRVTGGSRIKAIYYPADNPPPTLAQTRDRPPKVQRRQIHRPQAASEPYLSDQGLAEPVFANVIDSPPIDGFVPWVAVSITDARSYEWLDTYAVAANDVAGNFLTGDPASDYAMGIFDTGASMSLISYDAAIQTGIDASDLITSSVVELKGATGSAYAWASQPLGIFMDGLDAIDTDGLLTDTSGLVGQTNVSIIVGDEIDSPNVPTAIGSPVAAFFAAAFRNDREITVSYNGEDFNAPDITFYPFNDSNVTTYANKIQLELRPTAEAVAFWPCVEIYPGDCPDGDGSPLIPSTIWGFLPTQSLFFVRKVHLNEGTYTSNDNTKFMFDTGAQVTVISEGVAGDLHLNLNDPCFPVEIQDVTGEITIVPGFYVDAVNIPATGDWLTATNVPLVVLDVVSPEGGLLDGIIGMNLFTELNFVVHGGGLQGQIFAGYDPFISFQPICYLTGDIEPPGGDCEVDYSDLGELASHWLETSASPNWNPDADLAPLSDPDEKVDFLDLAVLAEHWGEQITP